MPSLLRRAPRRPAPRSRSARRRCCSCRVHSERQVVVPWIIEIHPGVVLSPRVTVGVIGAQWLAPRIGPWAHIGGGPPLCGISTLEPAHASGSTPSCRLGYPPHFDSRAESALVSVPL